VEEAEAFDEEAQEVIHDVLPPARPEKPADTPAPVDVADVDHVDDDQVVEYLAFMLASEEYAVKVEDVKEIIRGQRITTVPRTPEFVIGIISLRGVILPVFDIKKRLGLEGGGSRKTSRIIVVADKYGLQGITVDKVTGVEKLKQSAIEPPPAVIGGVEAEYLQGIGRIGDRLLILFNADKVLTVG
jgi:purine-binding chemotaxis protein CheW